MIIINLLTISAIIGFAFIVVAAEIALLQIKQSDTSTSDVYIRKMINNKNEFMSTIQVGITLSSMIAGWAGEPAMTELLFRTNIQNILGHKLTEIISFCIITYISIVVSELLPKNIAMAFPYKTLKRVVPFIKTVHIVFYPMVWLLDHSSTILSSFMKIPTNLEEEIINESSIIKSMQIGANDIQSDIKESDIAFIKNALTLNDTSVQDIMTPIDDISFDSNVFSRIPNTDYSKYSYHNNTHDLHAIDANSTADNALHLMSEYKTNMLKVVRNDIIIGIVTDTDIFKIIYPKLFHHTN